MAQIRYRPDIDGLRAIAVLTVVLFHANLGMSGGFVGVDVFFVISGFLITSIIVREISDGRFSFWNFYKRRALRILPALFAMIIGCFIVGWFVLPPFDYGRLARSAMAAVAFYPNFFFLNNSGYFAAEAITQPLLHTWSLGVEEQFYFVAPLLLIIGFRFPKYRTAVFVAIFLASLGWSIWELGRNASAAFYLLPSRAFELMTGMALGLNLFRPPGKARSAELMSASGLIMILAAALFYTEATPFPGIAALLPCVGTALLIHANADRLSASGRLLASAPLVFLGKISYSLYLWHWPVLVFGFYKFGADLEWPTRVALVSLAVLLATISYYIIEQPARLRGHHWSAPAVVAVAVASILLWWPATRYVRAEGGFPWRLTAEAAQFAERNPTRLDITGLCHDQVATAESGVNCAVGKEGGNKIFILAGDSHASAIALTVSDVAKANGLTGQALLHNGCPPLFGFDISTTSAFEKCVELSKGLSGALQGSPIKNVILHARWAQYITGERNEGEPKRRPRLFVEDDIEASRRKFVEMLTETVTILAKDHHVTLIGPVPESRGNVPAAMIKSLMNGSQATVTISRKAFDQRQAGVLELLRNLDEIDGVDVAYPHELLCDADECRTSIDGMSLYIDDDHLSPTGAKILIPFITRALER